MCAKLFVVTDRHRSLCIQRHKSGNMLLWKVNLLCDGAVVWLAVTKPPFCILSCGFSFKYEHTHFGQMFWTAVKSGPFHACFSPLGERWAVWWRAWQLTKTLSPTRTAASAKMNSSRSAAAVCRRDPPHLVSAHRPRSLLQPGVTQIWRLTCWLIIMCLCGQLQCSAC